MWNKYKVVLLSASSALALMAYAYLTSNRMGEHGEHEHEHHDHHHHHHDEGEDETVNLTPEHAKKEGIEIAKAGPMPLQRYIQANGILILNQNTIAHVVPKASGVVLTLERNLGEKVSAGDPLAIIESRALAEAKAGYLTALSKNKLNAESIELETRLYNKKITSGQDFKNAKNEAEAASIDLELAKQKLQSLGLSAEEIDSLTEKKNEYRLYTMQSPINGYVIERNIVKGEWLDGSKEAFVIADLESVWAELHVYSHELKHLNEGDKIFVLGSEGQEDEGEVIYISPIIDQESRTARAIAVVSNLEGKWHPGDYITVLIPAETHLTKVAVTAEAIQKIEGEDVVFIAQQNDFLKRPVKIGKSDGKFVEILSGLAPGEPYAAKNTFLLKAEHGKNEAEHSH